MGDTSAMGAEPVSSRKRQRRRDTDGAENGDGSKRVSTQLYKCGDCDKAYSRVDHLTRHVRQHTQERPYECTTCGKCFARVDLLKRHHATHTTSSGHPNAKNQNTIDDAAIRASIACSLCAGLHLRCDNNRPCHRCIEKGVACDPQVQPLQSAQRDVEVVAHDLLNLARIPSHQYQISPPVLAHTTTPASSKHPLPSPAESMHGQPMMHQIMPQAPSMGYNRTAIDPALYQTPNQSNLGPPQAPQPIHPASASSYAPNLEVSLGDGVDRPHFDGAGLGDFLQGIMHNEASGGANAGTHAGSWAPRNLFDLGADYSVELNSVDLGFLNDYNQNYPFHPDVGGPGSNTASNASETPRSGPPAESRRPQRSSVWQFKPAEKDSVHANLGLPEVFSTQERLKIDRRATKTPLSQDIRDQILAVIMAQRQGIKPVSFPSAGLLDSILQHFLTTSPVAKYLIHIPTFDPTKLRPEVCLAFVSAGAAQAPDTALRKLGMGFDEAARIATVGSYESVNTLIGDTNMLIASMCILDNGLWSGNSRKMELAESYCQPYTTMIRRRGWFRKTYEHVVPTMNDEGNELEAKWRKWVELETKKRLAFFIFRHDARASMSLFISPIISCADLSLPLPAPHHLWSADSAQTWKARLLANSAYIQAAPSVLDLLTDISSYVGRNAPYDVDIASQALISAAWGLIYEYRRQSAFVGNHPSYWNNGNFFLSSRMAEIKKLLEFFGMSPSASNPEMRIMIRILSMHLHVNLERIHIFAGVEGHQEARQVYPALKNWAQTAAARQAVLDAAQVLKYAKHLQNIRDFIAVAVYHAALTLWSYGLVMQASGNTRHSQVMVVLLDGEDVVAAQRFVNLDEGVPAIVGTTTRDITEAPISLMRPDAVTTRIMEILHSSHTVKQSMPPLVENLLELLENLRAAITVQIYENKT